MKANTAEEYWDWVADASQGQDNVAKKQVILSKILRHEMINCNVLEVGCGNGLIAAAIDTILMRHWYYTGTDVSHKFCNVLMAIYHLNAIKTDITNLPDGIEYHRIFLFDVLEHIPKQDINAGFKELGRVLHKKGRIFINNPSPDNICLHDKRFDFDFTLAELETLCAITETEITCLEPYAVNHIKKLSNGKRQAQLCKYTWIELSR